MIHLVHVRDTSGAAHWIRRRRRQITANPVPLLVIGITEGHAALQATIGRAGIESAYYIDATGVASISQELGNNVLVLSHRSELEDARVFIERARKARQRLDIVLVEDALQPDINWCGPLVDSFEAWA